MMVGESQSANQPAPPGQFAPGKMSKPRRGGILVAAALAALIAEVGICVSTPGEPSGASNGTSGPRSPSFSLIATDDWTPDPTAPPAEAPAPQAPNPVPNQAPAPAQVPVQAPPSNLILRYGAPSPGGIPAFISITNNEGKPPVGCTYNAVATSGPAATFHPNDTAGFTVTGSAETRLDRPGPASGSNWHVTVTCDNGLSTSTDQVF